MSAPQRKPLKYLPKSSTRRTEQERDAIARGEDERERKRQSEAARDLESERRRGNFSSSSSRGAASGHGGRGADGAGGNEKHRTTLRYARGGRGGFMGERQGRGSHSNTSQNARGSSAAEGGALKSSTAATSTLASAGSTSATTTSGRATRASKRETGSNARLKDGTRLKKEPDEELTGLPDLEDTSRRRINIEEIDLITPEGSDDEDALDVDGSSRKPNVSLAGARSSGLIPVRIKRRPHIDRIVGINTEASSTAAAEIRKKWQDGDTEKEVEDVLKTTLARSGSSSGAQGMIVDESRQWAEEAVSDREEEQPETRVKVKQESSSAADRRRKSGTEARSISPIARRQSRSRASETKKNKKPGLHFGWGDADWAIEEKDRNVLRDELGQPVSLKADKDGDTSMAEHPDHRSNNLYLFQFPPVMPELSNATQGVKREEPQSPILNKTDPAEGTDKVEQDTDVDAIKIDNDADGDFTVESAGFDGKSISGAGKEDTRRPKLEAGKAGKLRVHESGRITLSWGGVSFEVRRGMQRHYLQTAVLTSDEKHKHEDVQYDGNATSLGHIRGRFIVVPETDSLAI